ncbi:copper transporter complex subunit Ctr4 [Malassezia psittaci]|uniref:Copper transport protein n=1 Tax=Malassezia psittaci TaxID=1821823 RepID=A0AAF0F344_9BASI|nr:copper transporter complex subunit Ctr4 [Malassezia psittaci]
MDMSGQSSSAAPTSMDMSGMSSMGGSSNKGKFAGSCVGLAFWAMLTELVRRWAREYDRFIIAEATEQLAIEREKYPEEFDQHRFRGAFGGTAPQLRPRKPSSRIGRAISSIFNPTYLLGTQQMRLRPTLIQQMVRSILYAVQFTSAYLIMLVVMSFNAYVFISVVLGAMIGHFVASWDTLGALPYDSNGHCTPSNCAAVAPSGTSISEKTMQDCCQPTSKLPEAIPITPAASGLPAEGEAAALNPRYAAGNNECECR